MSNDQIPDPVNRRSSQSLREASATPAHSLTFIVDPPQAVGVELESEVLIVIVVDGRGRYFTVEVEDQSAVTRLADQMTRRVAKFDGKRAAVYRCTGV
jgi:hypothetical protein